MASNWYLEGAGAAGSVLIIPIDPIPFFVGRGDASELTIATADISRRHALIDTDGHGGLEVHDLGSTNGTCVNGERVTDVTPIHDGDVIHFGYSEFRLKFRSHARAGSARVAAAADNTRLALSRMALPHAFPRQEKEFRELLEEKLLSVAFQPIVNFSDRKVIAYEVLGRGRHPDLPSAPVPLFALAAAFDSEVELSQAFRAEGAWASRRKDSPPRLFMNSHPREMFTPELYASLEYLRLAVPNLEITLEVDETAITEVSKMRVMAQRIRDMGISLAYDDFGVGQARINELAEVPPDVVKFDISLIRAIDKASSNKQQVVSKLVHIVKDLGSVPLAEGVETEEEAAVCLSMGFELCQGYLTGRPVIV